MINLLKKVVIDQKGRFTIFKPWFQGVVVNLIITTFSFWILKSDQDIKRHHESKTCAKLGRDIYEYEKIGV